MSGMGFPEPSSCGVPSGFNTSKPTREQLQHFSSVILVGPGVGGWIGFVIVHHVQVIAHDRAQRDVVQQRGEVAEGVFLEHVRPQHKCAGVVHLVGGSDHDLRKGEAYPLPQLVLTDQGIGEKALLHDRHIVVRSRCRIG